MSYTLTLTADELNALLWVADRYESAAVLWAHMEDNDDGSFTIPEFGVWDYLAHLPEDNGVADAILPPCVGGTLAEKLIDLYESVV